jgi:hypothetical protein
MELTKEYFDEKLSQLVSKEDLDQKLEGVATKDDLLQVATHNDIAAVRLDISEVKDLVDLINDREDQDTRAVMGDIVDLNRRVSALERPTTNA